MLLLLLLTVPLSRSGSWALFIAWLCSELPSSFEKELKPREKKLELSSNKPSLERRAEIIVEVNKIVSEMGDELTWCVCQAAAVLRFLTVRVHRCDVARLDNTIGWCWHNRFALLFVLLLQLCDLLAGRWRCRNIDNVVGLRNVVPRVNWIGEWTGRWTLATITFTYRSAISRAADRWRVVCVVRFHQILLEIVVVAAGRHRLNLHLLARDLFLRFAFRFVTAAAFHLLVLAIRLVLCVLLIAGLPVRLALLDGHWWCG